MTDVPNKQGSFMVRQKVPGDSKIIAWILVPMFQKKKGTLGTKI
jgi:hypothetical protein